MIITDSFVHVANPRCGSTFSRKVIKTCFDLACASGSKKKLACSEVLHPNIRGLTNRGKDHHGTVSQIPEDVSTLPIVSSVRHPVSLAMSTFRLGLWVKRIREEKESFPVDEDLGPMRCLSYLESTMPKRWQISRETHGIGYFTAHFLTMFSRSPNWAFQEARAGRFSLDLMDETIPAIVFHQQENLADDLRSSLSLWVGNDIAERATSIGPRNVSNKVGVDSFELDQAVENFVLAREVYLLRFLERRGIAYS